MNSKARIFFFANTLEALQKLAAYHGKQFNYPVIGITGSSGKTIIEVKWLYQLLSQILILFAARGL